MVAAVAAQECFAALGSDTGGSIRQPASYCGVVGMKPTYGTVSRYGLVAYGSSLDQIGPLCKDVRDCATILEVISTYDEKDSTSIKRASEGETGTDFTSALKEDMQGLRIGIPRDYFGEGLDSGVKEAVLDVAKELEKKGAASEFGKSIIEFAKRQATGDLEDELKKAEEERAQTQAQLSSLQNSLLDDDVYSGHTDPGAIVEGASEEKSGKNKKPSKYVEPYNTVAMRFLGAIAAQDSRFKTSVLHAASGYILGGGTAWKDIDANTINPLGVTQEALESVIPDGDMKNPENVARAFVLIANSFNGTAEEFLDDWLQRIGLANDALEAALIRGKIMNQAEYFENGLGDFGGIDYGKKKNTFAIDDRMTSLKTEILISFASVVCSILSLLPA